MIYFVEAENGLIKIGMSADVKRRFRILQMESPIKLKLLGAINSNSGSDNGFEAALHSKFKSYWHHGEWFIGKEIKGKIRKIIRKETI